MPTSAEIRGRLGHPVIDSDGHMAEHLPTLAPYLEQEGLSLDHPALRRLLPAVRRHRAPWHEQTLRNGRPPAPPAALVECAGQADHRPGHRPLPRLLYERLDEIGHRLRRGLSQPRAGLHARRRRALPPGRMPRPQSMQRRDIRTLSDRLTPVAAIPMHTPEEAVAELEYAVNELGFKAVVCAGYVQRPFDALAGKDPEVARYAFWLDQFGIDSAYDYDPVWAKAPELGVSIAFHSGSSA